MNLLEQSIHILKTRNLSAYAFGTYMQYDKSKVMHQTDSIGPLRKWVIYLKESF